MEGDDKLIACPHCGAEPLGLFGPHAELGSFWVECHGVNPDERCGDWHIVADSREEAARAWNTRHQSPAHDEGDTLQTVKDCVKRNLENMPQLPCRVEEMTPREHEIFNILAGLCGALEFIDEVLGVHALAERPEANATAESEGEKS